MIIDEKDYLEGKKQSFINQHYKNLVNKKLNSIVLPEKPEENWTYKNRPLSPIYLPKQ